MFYIPTDTLETAKAVSRAFYQLSRPQSVQSPDDVSQYYSSWVEHPRSKAVMLEISDDDLYIHPEANEKILDPFLEPLVKARAIKEQELIQVQEVIASHKGKQAPIKDLILDYWKQQSKTRQQLQQEGWFGNASNSSPNTPNSSSNTPNSSSNTLNSSSNTPNSSPNAPNSSPNAPKNTTNNTTGLKIVDTVLGLANKLKSKS